MQKLSVVVLALVMLVAVALPLPTLASTAAGLVEHWNPLVRLKLAQCFIAEADENVDDWTAVAFSLKNWLEVRQRRWPHLRYVDVAKGVCSVHKLGIDSLSKRQSWIRDLDFPRRAQGGKLLAEKPEGFPTKSSWERKQRYWLRAWNHAQEWYNGQHRDPCRGKAVLWGAPSDPDNRWYLRTDDPALKGMKVVRLACSDRLSNDFYRLMTRSEREESERFAQCEDTRAEGRASRPDC